MTELSPQAQEVFWAFNRAASGKPDDWHYLPAIAAALKAAVDQVVPETATPWNSTLTPCGAGFIGGFITDDGERFISAKDVRSEILAIANEFETND